MSEPVPSYYGRLEDLVRYWAAAEPDADCFIDEGGVLSYSDVVREFEGLGRQLRAGGVCKGDRVAVLSHPSAGFGVSFFGTLDAGAVWVGLNPKYREPELRHVLEDCTPTLVVIDASVEGENASAELEMVANALGVRIARMSADHGLVDDDGVEWPSAPAPRAPTVTHDDDGLIIYTSGTTGKPKGAMIRHRALRKTSLIQARLIGVERPRVLNNLPINHIGCVGDIMTSNLAAGGAIIFQRRFGAQQGFELIAKHKVSVWGQIPTMFLLALEHESAATADLGSVECILFSGAPADVGLVERLLMITPNVINAYGMTETVGSVSWAIGCGLDVLVSTVGFPVAEYPVRVADEMGQKCAVGEVGEIQVGGDCLMSGYWGKEQASKEAFTTDGYLRTGDLGRFNPDGSLVLAGRLKERFKSGGYNVYPREVEAALADMPGVAEVVVVATPDEKFFEVGYAFLRPVKGEAPSIEHLKELCGARMANYKTPKYFKLLDAFPLLANGKIDRHALKQLARRSVLKA